MGIFDNSQFMAPGGLQPPSVHLPSDFLAYKDSEREKEYSRSARHDELSV